MGITAIRTFKAWKFGAKLLEIFTSIVRIIINESTLIVYFYYIPKSKKKIFQMPAIKNTYLKCVRVGNNKQKKLNRIEYYKKENS